MPSRPFFTEATAARFSGGSSSVGVSRTRFPLPTLAKSVPFAVAIFISSPSTKSCVICVRLLRASRRSLRYSCTSGFCIFRTAMRCAPFGLYPARSAACVALRSMRYSSQKAFCRSVRRPQHPTTTTCLKIYPGRLAVPA